MRKTCPCCCPLPAVASDRRLVRCRCCALRAVSLAFIAISFRGRCCSLHFHSSDGRFGCRMDFLRPSSSSAPGAVLHVLLLFASRLRSLNVVFGTCKPILNTIRRSLCQELCSVHARDRSMACVSTRKHGVHPELRTSPHIVLSSRPTAALRWTL